MEATIMETTQVRTNLIVLQKMAKLINENNIKLPLNTPSVAHVEKTWLDAGQGVWWNTIIVGRDEDFTSWQYINPNESDILNKLNSNVKDAYLLELITLINDVCTCSDYHKAMDDYQQMRDIVDEANEDLF